MGEDNADESPSLSAYTLITPLVRADGDAVPFVIDGDDKAKALLKTEEPPADKYFISYMIMLLLGAGLLFPYNTVVTAADYFTQVFPTSNCGPEYAPPNNKCYPNIVFFVPLFINITSPLIQMALMKYGHLLSFSVRIVLAFSIESVVIMAIPYSIENFDTQTALVSVLGVIFLLGIATAILQSTVFAFSGMLPPIYTQAVMSGNGIAGVVVCVCRIATKAGFGDTTNGARRGALLYFVLAAFTTIMCVIGYLVLTRLPFIKHYTSDSDVKVGTRDDKTITKQSTRTINNNTSGSSNLRKNNAAAATAVVEVETIVDNEVEKPAVSYRVVWGKVYPLAGCVFFVFVITFVIFPGLLTVLKTDKINNGWYTVFLLTEFNVLDLIGRSLPGFLLLFSSRTLWIPVAIRTLFFPAFLFCSAHYLQSWGYYFPFAVNALFAISNGYTASLAMMYGPAAVAVHEKQAAGYIMSTSLNLGILVGSSIAIMNEYAFGVGKS